MFIRRFTNFLYLARRNFKAVILRHRVRNPRGDIVTRLLHGQELGERDTLFHRRGDNGYRVEFTVSLHDMPILHESGEPHVAVLHPQVVGSYHRHPVGPDLNPIAALDSADLGVRRIHLDEVFRPALADVLAPFLVVETGLPDLVDAAVGDP